MKPELVESGSLKFCARRLSILGGLGTSSVRPRCPYRRLLGDAGQHCWFGRVFAGTQRVRLKNKEKKSSWGVLGAFCPPEHAVCVCVYSAPVHPAALCQWAAQFFPCPEPREGREPAQGALRFLPLHFLPFYFPPFASPVPRQVSRQGQERWCREGGCVPSRGKGCELNHPTTPRDELPGRFGEEKPQPSFFIHFPTSSHFPTPANPPCNQTTVLEQ